MNLFKRDIMYFIKTENHLQYSFLNAVYILKTIFVGRDNEISFIGFLITRIAQIHYSLQFMSTEV